MPVLDTPGLDPPGLDPLAWDIMAVDTTWVRGSTMDTLNWSWECLKAGYSVMGRKLL